MSVRPKDSPSADGGQRTGPAPDQLRRDHDPLELLELRTVVDVHEDDAVALERRTWKR
jgi:hypothetical protein